MMARLPLLVIALAAIAAGVHGGKVHNQLIVTYGIVPDPFHSKSFFSLPRTLEEAQGGQDYWIPSQKRPQDNTTSYCREGDYRVCLLFDQQGSVAGIRLSVDRNEIAASGFNLENVPEWEPNWNSRLPGMVYSATVYFQSADALLTAVVYAPRRPTRPYNERGACRWRPKSEEGRPHRPERYLHPAVRLHRLRDEPHPHCSAGVPGCVGELH
ncbi:uncharacterized protein LOC117648585 isoform X2 [Thrips palmi]|uniref:Uncharacterized protein LOC117648585 isoform X2 n=1 Tax=Thrips palmi TaxID=161013 RepID=A0A6P8ZR61_THRPL|nr:uncharacterized protein LOC117648585 isoform X2 [Thrips palmi]